MLFRHVMGTLILEIGFVRSQRRRHQEGATELTFAGYGQ